MSKQKVRNLVYAANSDEFIAPVCHYNQNTLLTRNGQLIQVISICDIHKLGNAVTALYEIRNILRQSIQTHLDSNRFSFWISVVRSKTDITSDVVYQTPFCNDLNNAWCKQNSWDARYANSLYISIVYYQADLSVNNLTSFLNTFNKKIIYDFHNDYLASAAVLLDQLSSKITADLQIFNAKRLGIIMRDGVYISELQKFLGNIIYMQQLEQELQNADISKVLKPQSYGVGYDHIELKYHDQNHYAGVIGIKEYQEMSIEILDTVIQVPAEMIITEMIKIIDKQDALKDLSYSNYIMQVSGDTDAQKASGIEQMIAETGPLKFCQHQINISVINSDYNKMLDNISIISDALSRIGVVNVKEDIDVEFAFWSRIPGNFNFIKRSSPAMLDHIAGFSSLYSFAAGDMQSIWGDYVTILNTQNNTPYYFNFHEQGNGHTVIFSCKKQGKTVLVNFLLAMSAKYNPDVLYIYESAKPAAFLEFIGAKILNHLELPNPLVYLDQSQVLSWLTILCSADKPLKANEVECLSDIAKYFSMLPLEERFFSKLEAFDFTQYQNIDNIKNRLALFIKQGKYSNILFNNTFDRNKFDAFDLSFLSNASFAIANYPKQEKLIPNYLIDLQVHSALRSAVVFMLANIFLNINKNSNTAKILVLNDLDNLVSSTAFNDIIPNVMSRLTENNGILLSSFCLDNYQNFNNCSFWDDFLKKQATVITFAGDGIKKIHQKFLQFSDQEMFMLLNLPSKGRYCVLKQYGFAIVIGMNLNPIIKFSKILSLSAFGISQYKSLQKQNLGKDMLQKLYEQFDV